MQLFKFALRRKPPIEVRIHGGYWLLFGVSYENVAGFQLATVNLGPFALQVTWGDFTE